MRGIFKGEASRPLVNCSTSLEYNKRIAELRQTLRTRGYPECVMPDMPYDASRRQSYPNKYRCRNNACSSRSRPFLKISVPYSQQLRQLKLKSRADCLLSRLRAQLGSDFLGDARILVAYDVEDCLFRSSYGMSFIPDTI